MLDKSKMAAKVLPRNRDKLIYPMVILFIVWSALLYGLMITDVWDETQFLMLVNDGVLSNFKVADRLAYVWTHSLGLYRPLPTSVAIILEAAGADFVVLRFLSGVLLFFSVWIIARIQAERFSVAREKIVFSAALLLFGSSGLVVSSWFANLFDSFCLFFLVLAFRSQLKGDFYLAAIFSGVAFFCKETAVFSVFIFMLGPLENSKSCRRDRMLSMLVAAFIALVYLILRQRVIEFASASDIHGFNLSLLPDSARVFVESYWFQHTKFRAGSAWAWLGLLVFSVSMALLRNWFLIALNSMVVVLAAGIYCGMVSYQGDEVINHLNFVGRLYLIPVVASLFIFTVNKSWLPLLVVALPVFLGSFQTYADHRSFQRVYKEIYKEALVSENGLNVYYPAAPLLDKRRRLKVGSDLSAEYCIESRLAILRRCAE